MLKAFVLALWYIPTRRITNVHLGDGLLAPLGLVIKLLTGRKVTVTVHGLDVTYKNRFYQLLVPRCLSRLDAIICISEATKQACLERDIPERKLSIIPWGVELESFRSAATRHDLETICGMDLTEKRVLLTVGRLVKRKGVAWFVDNVLPSLGPEYVYLVAGEGPERMAIEAAARRHDLLPRIKLLGAIPEREKVILYNTADVFVMPNIPVAGDIEGFGIVALEAAAAGLPVVASDLEGIKGAIIDGKTGYKVSAGISSEYITCINRVARARQKNIAEYVEQYFSWRTVTRKYLASFGGRQEEFGISADWDVCDGYTFAASRNDCLHAVTKISHNIEVHGCIAAVGTEARRCIRHISLGGQVDYPTAKALHDFFKRRKMRDLTGLPVGNHDIMCALYDRADQFWYVLLRVLIVAIGVDNNICTALE